MATPTPVQESKPGQIAAKTNRPQLRLLVDGMSAANDLGLTDAVPARVTIYGDAIQKDLLEGFALLPSWMQSVVRELPDCNPALVTASPLKPPRKTKKATNTPVRKASKGKLLER